MGYKQSHRVVNLFTSAAQKYMLSRLEPSHKFSSFMDPLSKRSTSLLAIFFELVC